MKSRIAIAGLFLLFGLASCNLTSLDEPIVVANVEDEFYIDLWEDLGKTERTFSIIFQTIENFECTNFSINVSDLLGEKNFNFIVNEIITPNNCDPGQAPAIRSIGIGDLNAGPYNLNINLKNIVTNQGRLNVGDDRFTIYLETENGIKLLHRELRRVPDQFIWGFLSYEEPEMAATAQEFLNTIDSSTEEIALEPGYYGYFTIKDDGTIFILRDVPANTTEITSFFYRYDQNTGLLEDAVEAFKSEHPEVQLLVRHSDGSIF